MRRRLKKRQLRGFFLPQPASWPGGPFARRAGCGFICGLGLVGPGVAAVVVVEVAFVDEAEAGEGEELIDLIDVF